MQHVAIGRTVLVRVDEIEPVAPRAAVHDAELREGGFAAGVVVVQVEQERDHAAAPARGSAARSPGR